MTGGEAFRKASRLAVLPVVALLSWPALVRDRSTRALYALDWDAP